MALKKASNKIEVLEISGSEVHAVKPDKSTFDDYRDKLFQIGDDGKIKRERGSVAIKELYKLCVKKLVKVTLDDGTIGDIENSDQIVEFLAHLEGASEGTAIDSWLLGLAELTKAEAKN